MRYLILLLCLFPLLSQAQDEGEKIFRMNCGACHSVGKGKLVGPDLLGVLDRRDEDWVKRFIKSSQTMVAEGDSLAITLFQENSFIPMPDQPLSDDEIQSVLEYISIKPSKSNNNQITSTKTQQIGISKGNKKSRSWIEKALFSPIYWLVGLIPILILVVIFVLTDVIKTLSNKLIESEKEKRELFNNYKN